MNQADTKFDAALYWANKPIKKFVCTIKSDNGEMHQCICGSSCSDRAAEIAIENSHLQGVLTCTEIRLATPEDLGATATLQPTIKEKLRRFASSNDLREVDSGGHLLVGNLPAIEHVNALKAQCNHLSVALVDCLALMAQCQQYQEYPKLFSNPINSLPWQATIETARALLKAGNLQQFEQSKADNF
ncbi:hypothetical protein [Pseudoalteromonas sp. R3]|uniref:hypothetical protein n=1 Tax=Pseudoalteromonas sp. R3 TaxID=1709477 RepID=UPI0006B56900|nr:hypothetical protein [Pseudoalteromonas sp. R3]AZZ97985.1 hypothetical protein ELR70_13200 [Pseudoalteromonas sp. R3]